MESNDIKALTKRMDVIINLMMRDIKFNGNNITDAEKIKLLNDMGLKYTEIADIMGKTPTNVSVVLAKLKRKK
ncbi:hypothetical protein CEE44_03545 [Candidatus Woesearchaeota archaeon B3_Woes]|nr:MAG: hypothetical protein CEE44_03545 [Candidatus Woesearchaeota archaeon B3_Woes]